MGSAYSTEEAMDKPPPPIEENYTVLETPASTEATKSLDVQRFLSLLAKLAKHHMAGGVGQGTEAEVAAGLFSWGLDFHVARAPGRLDVMGGISDYSGSRVLQMPTAEACVVALQKQPESRSVRVLSFGATAGGRAPLFEMPLGELLGPDGKPKPLAELQAKLAADPSTAWAAYVVGTLAVLMHEENVRFEAGMAFLIRSDVPEGKGVSSSAAVEVASMMALMAAHGVTVAAPERVAVLCQKVENLVVGAPCAAARSDRPFLAWQGPATRRCPPLVAARPRSRPPFTHFTPGAASWTRWRQRWGAKRSSSRSSASPHSCSPRCTSRRTCAFGASTRACATQSAAPTTALCAARPSWAAPSCAPPPGAPPPARPLVALAPHRHPHSLARAAAAFAGVGCRASAATSPSSTWPA
jgi:hypothetical protein